MNPPRLRAYAALGLALLAGLAAFVACTDATAPGASLTPPGAHDSSAGGVPDTAATPPDSMTPPRDSTTAPDSIRPPTPPPLPPDSSGPPAPPPAPSGSVVVRTTSRGATFDADGYTASVATRSQSAGLEDSVAFGGVAAGTVTVGLGGVAGNCVVEGGGTRAVTVPAAGTAAVSFSITCSASAETGIVPITLHTDGANLDPDGYTVSVTGGQTRAVATGAVFDMPGVASGLQRVTLAGLASNCSVTNGSNPRYVTVNPGTAGTAAVEFAVSCR